MYLDNNPSQLLPPTSPGTLNMSPFLLHVLSLKQTKTTLKVQKRHWFRLVLPIGLSADIAGVILCKSNAANCSCYELENYCMMLRRQHSITRLLTLDLFVSFSFFHHVPWGAEIDILFNGHLFSVLWPAMIFFINWCVLRREDSLVKIEESANIPVQSQILRKQFDNMPI